MPFVALKHALYLLLFITCFTSFCEAGTEPGQRPLTKLFALMSNAISKDFFRHGLNTLTHTHTQAYAYRPASTSKVHLLPSRDMEVQVVVFGKTHLFSPPQHVGCGVLSELCFPKLVREGRGSQSHKCMYREGDKLY